MLVTLQEFNKIYKYKSDLEKYGFSEVWEIPQVSDDGFVYADCESYARYLKNNIPEFKDWGYYYCKLNGQSHCILYKNGDAIDCNIKHIFSFDEYCRVYKITELKKYNWFVVFSKILFSNIYLLYRKIRGI